VNGQLRAALAGPLVDPPDLAAERITFLIEQAFRYEYDQPVEWIDQRLVVVPPAQHGDAHRRAHRVEVDGAASVRRRARRDAAGNTVVRGRAAGVERFVEFRIAALVERVRGDGPPRLPASALRDPKLLRPTRLTAPSGRLDALAAAAWSGGGDLRDRASRLCTAAHEALTYEYGITSVSTTADEAFGLGRGVCQDSAHLMLALCHSVGLPARYVSGHLLGRGGTHAWVEVVVPDGDGAVAIAYDPCHGRTTDAGYVTVATGRDYREVAPTSGTFRGPSTGRLTCSRRLAVVPPRGARAA
jgi:transglutaminase-like putative cysteine protease